MKVTPLLIKLSFITGTIEFISLLFLKAVYDHYFILVVPFLFISSGYYLVDFVRKNKIPTYLQLAFFLFLFFLTIPQQIKWIKNDITLYKQVELNQCIKKRSGENGRILSSNPSVLFVKPAHFLFFQTNKTVENRMMRIYKKIIDNPDYKFWVTNKIKKDARYKPKELIMEQKPEFVYANPNFINDWDLNDLLSKHYKQSVFENLYEKNIEKTKKLP